MNKQHGRRFVAGLVAVLGLAAALPATAQLHYFCYLHDPYQDRGFYLTPILVTRVESIDDSSTGSVFADYARDSGLRWDGGSVKYGCVSSPNPDAVLKNRAYYLEQYPGMVEVDWPEPPVPSEPAEAGPPMQALVIEEPEPPALTEEEIAARILAEERRHAAALAVAVAEGARRDAELQAKLQEIRERARRRGRMQ